MPGRTASLLILLFWLLAVAWQLSRAFTAPYTAAPKLLASLRLAVEDGETTWKITHNNLLLGTTVNDVKEDRAIGYILRQQVTLDSNLDSFLGTSVLGRIIPLRLAESLALTMNLDIQVTQFGSLHRFTLTAAAHLDKHRKDGVLKAFISGRAEEGYLVLSGNISVQEQKFPLPDSTRIRYDNKNLFMSSMAPADCLPDLRPGQTWEAPVLDLKDLIANPTMGLGGTADLALPSRKPAVVKVREDAVEYLWHGKPTRCWLVESKQRGLTIQLWVRIEDGRVLRQQAKWGESALELVREPGSKPRPAPKRPPRRLDDEDEG